MLTTAHISIPLCLCLSLCLSFLSLFLSLSFTIHSVCLSPFLHVSACLCSPLPPRPRLFDSLSTLNVEMLKVKAEGVARAEQERLNKDLRAEQLVLQAGETRKTVIQGIREAGQTIGEGFHNFVTDPQKVAATVGIVTAVAVGVYAAKSGAHVTGQYISNRLARPPLVRETSRTNPMLHPLKTLRNRFRKV